MSVHGLCVLLLFLLGLVLSINMIEMGVWSARIAKNLCTKLVTNNIIWKPVPGATHTATIGIPSPDLHSSLRMSWQSCTAQHFGRSGTSTCRLDAMQVASWWIRLTCKHSKINGAQNRTRKNSYPQMGLKKLLSSSDPALKRCSAIVSDIPSGSIYGIFIYFDILSDILSGIGAEKHSQ